LSWTKGQLNSAIRSSLILDRFTAENAMRKTIALALLSVACLTAAACNTVAGVGRDVSAVGDAVASGAERARR
jgi:entericidin B